MVPIISLRVTIAGWGIHLTHTLILPRHVFGRASWPFSLAACLPSLSASDPSLLFFPSCPSPVQTFGQKESYV